MTTFTPSKQLIAAILAERVYHTGEIVNVQALTDLTGWEFIGQQYDAASGYFAEAWGHRDSAGQPYSDVMQVTRGTAFSPAKENPLGANLIGDAENTKQTEIGENASIIFTGTSSYKDPGINFLQILASQFPQARITEVGHSLGGWTAGALVDWAIKNLAGRDVTGIAFNPLQHTSSYLDSTPGLAEKLTSFVLGNEHLTQNPLLDLFQTISSFFGRPDGTQITLPGVQLANGSTGSIIDIHNIETVVASLAKSESAGQDAQWIADRDALLNAVFSPDGTLRPQVIKDLLAGKALIADPSERVIVDPNDKSIKYVAGKTSRPLLYASDVGQVFGSQLGKLVGGNNQFAQIAAGTTLGVIGRNIGQEIDAAGGAKVIGFKDFGIDLAGAGIGAIGSFLFGELIDATGIGGFGAQALNSIGGTVIGQIATNIANHAADIFQGVGSAASIEIAFGSFLGSWLGSKVFHFDTVEGQIGASIGSALGGIAAASIIGDTAGLLANLVIPGLGAFLGFALGGLIGSLFGGGTPRSAAMLYWDGTKFKSAPSWSVHSSTETANAIASSVAQVFNDVFTATGAKLAGGGTVRTGGYGMDGSDFVYWVKGGDGILNQVGARFKNANDLINAGVYVGLSDLASQLVGGNVYVKRAVAAAVVRANGNAGSINGGSFSADILAGNIKVAQDYATYLTNAAVINAEISVNPEDEFSAAWIATLGAAFDLGLNKRWVSDWAGGWNAFMDAAKGGQVDGDAFTPGNLSLSLDANSRDRTFSFLDGNGNAIGSLGDTINAADKTQITATSGNDTIIVSGDTISNTTGLTIDGVAANGSAKKIDVAAVIDAGAGDDTVRAGDLGNDVLGGTGNDTLVGGKLDDWLFGDDGNDRLFAGSVTTTSFTDADTPSINAALSVDGGNGNYLEGGAGDDRLYGGTGSDWLSGGAGNDIEYGGDGGDILTGGAGSDDLEGGLGTDQYLFSFGDGADTVFDAGLGEAVGSTGFSASARIAAIASGSLQKDWAGTGNYTANGSVVGGVDAITFGAGISMINLEMARSGNDMIIKLGTWDSGYNTFTLTGDQLTVKDWFTDSRTIEWFRFADGEEIRMSDLGSVVRGTAGSNYIVGTAGTDFLFGLGGADSIRAMAGNDFAYGGSGDDFITGDGGDDLVVGGSGDDRVQGNAGQDTLTGDDGNDNVYGGAGDDIISGGKGDDFLAGGSGNDIFKYTRGDGIDTIIDEYVNSWDTVWTGAGGYQNGYTLNSDGTVTKNGVTYFDDGWIGFYTYDADTQVLKRFTATTNIMTNSGNDTIEFTTGIDIQDIEFFSANGDLTMGVMANGDDSTAFANLTDKVVLKGASNFGRQIENLVFTATGSINIATTNIMAFDDGVNTITASNTGPNWMTGLGGDDVLGGNSGADIIAGDQGSDTLRGWAGDDVLYGGADNDTLDGGAGKDALIGGAGEDTVTYVSSAAGLRVSLGYTLANSGDAFGDTFDSIEDLRGSGSADTLIGDDGSNMLQGMAGVDTLRGGLGDDTYYYVNGDGADIINEVGISGAEEVLDVNGVLNSNYTPTWTYIGTTVVNSTTYYAYRLVVTDNRTSQVVYQSRDNVDYIYTTPGQTLPAASTWFFQNGQWLLDTMRTGNNYQTVRTFDGSGGGVDTLLLQNNSLAGINIQRSGADLLVYVGSTAIRIKNQTTASTAIERLVTLDGLVASLTALKLTGEAGTSGDDFYAGNGTADVFHGGDGNDIISGGGGSDTLYGDNGDDVLEGGDGADTFDGGSDSESLGLAPDPTNITKPYGDTIRYVTSGAVTVNLATRVLSGAAGSDVIVAVNGVSTIENVTGSDTGADTLTGDSRANRLFGLGGNDNLTGAAGDDVLVGGAGNDTLHGDDGNDNLSGGDGDDIIYGGNNDDLISGDAGNDTLYGELGNDIMAGGDGNDTLTASDGDDQLGGGAGVDTLNGDNGNDALSGGDGDDFLYGGAGNDTLSGDAGNDVIQGGLNDDTYVFSTTAGNDTLTDSDGKNGIVITDATHDRIWLSQSGSDLMVGIIGSTASIRVVNYFATTTPSLMFSIATTDETLFLKYAGPLITAMGAISATAPASMPQSVTDLLPTYWDVGTKAAPGVTDQSVSGDEDTVITGSVGAIDHDDNIGTDATITAYTTASGPAHGTLNLNAATGAWSYTPVANYNGADSFSIKVTDADKQSVTQTVSVTLIPVPDPPDVPTLAPSVSSVAERDNPDPTGPVPAAIKLGVLSGTDPDLTAPEALQQLVYSVSDSRFEIRNGNELWLAAGVMPSIDFEASPTPTVSVTVTVKDNFGSAGFLYNSQTFTFAISDQTDYFVGGAGNDTLTGTVGADYISGMAGNDTLSGLGGDDTLLGGTGTDSLDGGAGNDYLQADDGDDTLLGGSGNDMLLGNNDNDTLDGGTGNDTLSGGSGNDTLLGGAGADANDGGAGTDTLSYAASTSGVTVDLVAGTGTGGDAQGDTITGIEVLIGSEYNDTLTGTIGDEQLYGAGGSDVISGGGGADWLYGGAGDDTITGADGVDHIYGDDGNDHLIGGPGGDFLYGGNGNDWLEAQGDGDLLDGGAGDDIMDGGIGSDAYVLGINTGNDIIMDYDPTGADMDQVNYTGVDPTWLWFQQIGNDLKVSIIGASATVTVKDWFLISASGNHTIETWITNTHYSVDANGLAALMATKTKPADLAALATLMADSSYSGSWASLWGTNAPPVVAPIANKTTNEDTVANIAISASDDTTAASQLVYTLEAYNDAAHTQANTTFISAAQLQNPVVTGPANGQTLSITPSANISGTVYLVLDVRDLTNKLTSQSFTLTVNPVADLPTLTVSQTVQQAGNKVYGTLTNSAISLDRFVDAAVNDPSESLSIQISGLQTLTLNHGTNLGGGVWKLTAADLVGLQINQSNNWSNDLTLGITATSTESDNSTATTPTQTVTVLVNAPPTGLSGSLAIAENSNTTVGYLTGIDPDANDILTYTLLSTPTTVPNGLFALTETHHGFSDNQAKITVSNLSLLDYEALRPQFASMATNGTVSIKVHVQDQAGLSNDISVPVTITDVNETPFFFTSGTAIGSVPENSGANVWVASSPATDPDIYNTTNSTLSYSLLGSDAGAFWVNSSGNIYTSTSLNYEVKSSYNFTVRATDGGGIFVDRPVSISVSNANDPQIVQPGSFHMSEAALPIGAQGAPYLPVSVQDEDGGGNYTYTFAGGETAPFVIDATSGHIYYAGYPDYPLDYETKNQYTVTVRVQDNNSGYVSQADQTIYIDNANDAPGIWNWSEITWWPNDQEMRTFNVTFYDPEGDDVFLYWLHDGTSNYWWGGPSGATWDSYAYDDFFPDSSDIQLLIRDASGLGTTFHLGFYNGLYPPIVLDLDGNGVTLNSRLSSNVMFDMDGDGVAQRTGWVGAGDGLLALDRNCDGIINDGGEISFKGDVAGAVTDLEGLVAYDSNQNGLFDKGDDRFSEFKVWRDANQDGISTPDELKSLADYGIQAINLTSQKTGQTTQGASDNVLYATTDVVHDDGSISQAGDVFLAYDQQPASSPDQPVLPDYAPITPKADAPKPDASQPDAPKADAPKPDALQPNAPEVNMTSAHDSGTQPARSNTTPAPSTRWSPYGGYSPSVSDQPTTGRDPADISRYADTQQNFRALTQDAYTSLSKNALNPRGDSDPWSTTLGADHGIGTPSAVDIGVGLLDQQMLQMVAAMATFNAGESGTTDDAMERARRHFEGTEFLTAVPRTDFANGPRVA